MIKNQMVTTDEARNWAMELGSVEERPHFEKTSFRVQGKIFATMDDGQGIMVLKLSLMDQSLFCTFDEHVMYPVPNKWGKQGWTEVVLHQVPRDTFMDALRVAFEDVMST